MTAQPGFGFAATKLTAPTLPERLVRRSRLDRVLDASLGGQTRLVLASAPAGSGKSTLLASWLEDRPELSSWLQIETGDSDPTRFWACLVESIGRANATVAEAVRPVVTSSKGDSEVVVTALVNVLSALDEPVIVVIDDYHLIESPVVHAGMERLIELCPPTVIIVVATRVDPPFRLGRLRVRHHVAEVRGDDFRFDVAEASGMLTAGGVPLDVSLVERLCGRTEGWAAGLVLAGLSLERSPDPEGFVGAFQGDDQLVVDYMTDEFLAGVSDADRQRLLETSLLDQFHGPLVEAVTETSGGAAWLLDTAKVNQLLIGLDRTGSWYRYHHLLRDLLRLEAQQAFPERIEEIYRRAANWFESEGDLAKAVTYRLSAGDTSEVMRHMRTLGPALLVSGQIETLQGLLDAIGEPVLTDPPCALLSGWCDFIGGRYDAVEEWVEVTHSAAPPGLDRTITAPLRLNVLLGRGNVGAAFELAAELWENTDFEGYNPDLATVAGGVHVWAGRSEVAEKLLAVSCRQSEELNMPTSHLLSLIYRAINQFDQHGTAEGALRTLDTADRLGLPAYYRMAPVYAIRARSQTDPTSARADVNHAVELARRIPGDLALAFVLTTCGDTLIDLDDAAGPVLLADARVVVDRCPDPGIVGRYLTRIESRHGIAGRAVPSATALVEELTDRESAVLRYLPTAMSQRDIASELYVSRNTVKTHCAAIYRKLGVGDRKAAVQAARDAGLL